MSVIFSLKDIQILDEAVTASEQAEIAQRCSGPIWRFGWPVNSTPFARSCWHSFIAGSRRNELESCEMELVDNKQWGFISAFWLRIKSRYLPGATLLGVYANGQTFGQDSPIHRDNRSDEPGHTVVVFCNEHWATSWGGELVFYDDEKKNVVTSVLPKPGRIVIFNGEMPHSARSPAIGCDQLRVTLAFKTTTQGCKSYESTC